MFRISPSSDVDYGEEIGRDQMRVLQISQIVHRHHRHVGLASSSVHSAVVSCFEDTSSSA